MSFASTYRQPPNDSISQSHRRGRLDQDGGPVAKDFGHALHDLSGIVSQTDHRVRAKSVRMFQHSVERVSPRLLTKVGEDGNVAANEGLQPGPDGPKDRARTDDDAPDDAKRLYDATSVQGERGCGHARTHGLASPR